MQATAYFKKLAVALLVPLLLSWAVQADDTVKAAQERLRTLGYDPGSVDGVFGDKTRIAVQRFQTEKRLKVSGDLDPDTTQFLFADLVLYTQDFPPFTYPDPVTKELDGPAVKLISKTCQDAGLKCALILPAGSWEDTQKQVKDGKGDGLFLIGWDVKRAEHFLRTDEIFNTEYGFFVKADDPLRFTGAETMDGYMVGAFGPSNTSRTLQTIAQGLRDKSIRLDVDEQKTADPLFSKLETTDRKYAVFSNREVGNAIVRRLGLRNVRYAGRQQCLSYYVGIAKRRDAAEIIARFNQAFHHIDETGLKRVILAPYGISTGSSECGKSNDAQPPLPAEQAPRITADPPTVNCAAKKVGNDETVECSKSCLTWQKAGSDRPLTWHEAAGSYLAELNDKRFGGASDWRLPTTEELKTLLTKEVTRENRMFLTAGFSAQQTECWAADRRKDAAHDEADYVDYYNGAPGAKAPTDANYVRAVRGTYCGRR